jgi:chaperonin GroES
VCVVLQAARRVIPLLDRVLIQRVTAPTKSIGGVLLPEAATTKLNEVFIA